MKNKTIYIVIILAVVVMAVVFFASRSNQTGSNQANSAPTTSGSNNSTEQFTGFSLKDYSGNTVTSDQFKGKPLVINSWASWCPFCRQELPDFATAQKEFGDKVVIVAIDRSESLEVAKGYTDQQETTHNLIFLLDPSDSFYQSIGGFSMPETIFIDKNGNIVDHKRGPMDINEIRQRISKIL